MNTTILFVFRNSKPKRSSIDAAKKAVMDRITELWKTTSKVMSISAPLDITEVFDIKFTDLPEPPPDLPFNAAALSNIRNM